VANLLSSSAGRQLKANLKQRRINTPQQYLYRTRLLQSLSHQDRLMHQERTPIKYPLIKGSTWYGHLMIIIGNLVTMEKTMEISRLNLARLLEIVI
jgi:hypothetical protein